MIRIAISPAAFEASAATLALGSVGYEPQTKAKGERLVWLEAAIVDKLSAMRGPSESYSDVILRLVEIEAKGGGQNAAGAMKQQKQPAGQQNHAH